MRCRHQLALQIWLVSSLGIALLAPLAGEVNADDGQRWNVLFIFTDDMPHRMVSAYEEAYPWLRTPHLDRLSANGIRFEHAYAGPWCCPSRGMIMTGLQLHAFQRPERLRLDEGVAPSWLPSLRASGYQTCLIGKWDLPLRPSDHWDHSLVWNIWEGSRIENGKRIPGRWHPDHYYRDAAFSTNGEPPVVRPGYTTDLLTDAAVDFIHREHRQPWFMWLCFGAPHVPSIPPERHRRLYDDAKIELTDDNDLFGPRADVPQYQRNRSAVVRNGNRFERSFPPGKLLTELIRDYARTVRAIDDGIGQLVSALRESGQLNHTLIVFTSDDGMPFGEHGFVNKVGPYDACQRVPMIIVAPEQPNRGSVCRHPVSAIDLVPTILAVADVEPEYSLHGHDLSPLLANPQAGWPHPVLLECFGFSAGRPTHVGVTDYQPQENLSAPTGLPWWMLLRQGRFKYIRTLVTNEIEELYDIEVDPGERHNLAVSPAQHDRLNEFRALLDSELRRTGGAQLADHLPAPAGILTGDRP